jgi:hypothetical protein
MFTMLERSAQQAKKRKAIAVLKKIGGEPLEGKTH